MPSDHDLTNASRLLPNGDLLPNGVIVSEPSFSDRFILALQPDPLDGEVARQIGHLADIIDGATPRYEAALVEAGVQGHPAHVHIDDPVERQENLRNWARLSDQAQRNILSIAQSRPSLRHRQVAARLRRLARFLEEQSRGEP